jgi:hypothetical protein
MASSPAMSRFVVRSLVLIGALVASAVHAPDSPAADLPPEEAAPYTAVYKMTARQKDEPAEEWKYITEDTVTIAVLNKQIRRDRKTAGSTEIIDSVSRSTTSFGGKTPAGTAFRSKSAFVGIGWELGYGTVRKGTGKDPEVLGEATIAGQPCTRLKFVSEQYGEPEYCVAKNGVVLKFTNASDDAEATYEAVSIEDKAPDANRFVTPSELTIVERSGAPKKAKLPF